MSSWKLDTSHSQIEFAVKHMMITTVRGLMCEFEGELYLDEAHPERSSIRGSVAAASLDTKDPGRDAHLKSPDFLDVENYPQIRFRSSRISPAGANRYRLVGEITIKDVTREITFDVVDEGQAKDPWGNQRRGLSATSSFSRKEFGLNWNVALETGGWLVGDEVKVSAQVQLIQVQEPVVEAAETAAAG